MNYYPGAAIRRVRGLPEHLHDLAEHLGLLSARVRQTVAEAIGDTLGRTVKDLLNRCWSGQPVIEPPSPRRDDPIDPDNWRYADEEQSRHRSASEWDEAYPVPEQRQSPAEQPAARPTAGLLALALHAAGWWLRRRGAWLGALGVGALVGGAALLGGQAAIIGLGLAEAIGEVLVLHQLISFGAAALTAV
jgi:hypothetical protein